MLCFKLSVEKYSGPLISRISNTMSVQLWPSQKRKKKERGKRPHAAMSFHSLFITVLYGVLILLQLQFL